jgi:hypothetical protein
MESRIVIVAKIKGFTFGVILGVLASSNPASEAQVLPPSAVETTLARAAITPHHRISITNAMTMALSSAGVAGEIVIVAGCGDDPTYELHPTGPTLRDALNAIVAADPQYIWRLDGRVVNVTPQRGPIALLSTRIRELNVRNAHSVEEALTEILGRPEVRKRVQELNLTRGFMRAGPSDLARPGEPPLIQPSYNLSIKNATVQKALNAIARAHGKAVWQYRESRCNGKTEFQIEFLVR